MNEEETAYLGDGVYVTNDGYHIILTTSNGFVETNKIYLDPTVWSELWGYVERVTRK